MSQTGKHLAEQQTKVTLKATGTEGCGKVRLKGSVEKVARPGRVRERERERGIERERERAEEKSPQTEWITSHWSSVPCCSSKVKSSSLSSQAVRGTYSDSI